MRGVPSLMRPRMTSSLPPAVSLDNRGPKVRALICGGRWQIPQDWAKTWRPNFCVAVNPSSACCADAPPTATAPKRTAERTAKTTPERTGALRFILDPPDIAFLRAYAGAAPSGRLDPAQGGLTGMRSGGGIGDDLRMRGRARAPLAGLSVNARAHMGHKTRKGPGELPARPFSGHIPCRYRRG